MSKAHHGGEGIYNVVGNNFTNLERIKEATNADGLDAWFDPSPKAVSKLSEFLTFSIKTSPPVHAEGLIDTISLTRSVPKENILVAGGSSDLMFALFPNLNCKSAMILDPMYGEYRHIFENVIDGVDLEKYLLTAEKDFNIEISHFISAINDKRPDIVVIVNPNSPTGKFLNKQEVLEILKNIPPETIFVIDETYIDYLDTKESMETLVSAHDNLIIIKSMSKVYSLSGARVGYIVAPKSTAEKIDKHIAPFSVSTTAQILAIEVLKDNAYYQKKWEETRTLRSEFIESLKQINNIKLYFGEGNFILIELLGTNKGKAEEFVKNLASKNIFIRNADSMSSQFNGDFLRIAVRDKQMNEKITIGLKELL